MKLLADENIHSGIVAWLRVQGHDATTTSWRSLSEKAEY